MLDQEELLELYKRRFPKHTLKDMAFLTGINKTRIFRILNGHEMKLSEFNKFDELVNQNSLTKVVGQCTQSLPQKHLERLHSILERHLDSYLILHDMKAFCKNRKTRRAIV